MPHRNRIDLLEFAGRYANERQVPIATVTKEILHYDILYALLQSGAAEQLVFQGGTALRLCYQGTRYSEDLDFVAGSDFDPAVMEPFEALLREAIGNAYGLGVSVQAPRHAREGDGVHVARWSAKISIPQENPSLPQKQVIHIEVASVPAHDVEFAAVAVNYPHLPAPLRQLILATKTPREILADKMVALGARPYMKARDIWDIKFLTDHQRTPDMRLIAQKLMDYGWTESAFKASLTTRLAELSTPAAADGFLEEMRRFVDRTIAAQLANPAIINSFLRRAEAQGRAVLEADLSVAR